MKVIKKINIKEDLYYHVFKWLNKDIFHWGLTDGDVKILNELYIANFEMIDTVKESKDRMSILFSSPTKNKLIEKLNISYNTFNNSLTKLRKKGIIEGNSIDESKPLMLDLNTKEFNFTITLKDVEV